MSIKKPTRRVASSGTKGESQVTSETRQFIRYAMPGLVLPIELGVYLAVSHPQELGAVLSKMEFGAGVALFVLAGGLGYILNVVHHMLYWACPLPPYTWRREWLKKTVVALVKSKRMCLLSEAGKPTKIKPEELTDREAWVVLSSLLHEQLGDIPKFKSAKGRMDSLADITHSTGAALLACLLVIPGWILCSIEWGWCGWWRLCISASVFLVLLYAHCQSFLIAGDCSDGVQTTIRLDALHVAKECSIKMHLLRMPTFRQRICKRLCRK